MPHARICSRPSRAPPGPAAPGSACPSREIMRAHGGDIELVQTGTGGHGLSLDPADPLAILGSGSAGGSRLSADEEHRADAVESLVRRHGPLGLGLAGCARGLAGEPGLQAK